VGHKYLDINELAKVHYEIYYNILAAYKKGALSENS